MKIFLIGFMGSGKTHWGSQLASALNVPFFDLDTYITNREGKSIGDIFTENGEEYFRYKERDALESVATEQSKFILSCGGGTPCFFNNVEYMKKKGTVVWLNTSIEVLKERLMKERLSRPLIRNISPQELRAYIIRKLSERRLYYEQADLMVHEENIALNSLVELLHNE